MNTQLVVDINSKKEKSRFVKSGPSIFGFNENIIVPEKVEVKKAEKIWTISKDVSTNNEGIDLIVKEKGSLRTMYIQVKSRFGDNPDEIFTATTKASGVVDNYSTAVIFCYFDTEDGPLPKDEKNILKQQKAKKL